MSQCDRHNWNTVEALPMFATHDPTLTGLTCLDCGRYLDVTETTAAQRAAITRRLARELMAGHYRHEIADAAGRFWRQAMALTQDPNELRFEADAFDEIVWAAAPDPTESDIAWAAIATALKIIRSRFNLHEQNVRAATRDAMLKVARTRAGDERARAYVAEAVADLYQMVDETHSELF